MTSRRAQRRRGRRERCTRDDQVAVMVAWCAEESDLPEARQQTHDRLIASLGAQRRGGVTWRWWTGHAAEDALASIGEDAVGELAEYYGARSGTCSAGTVATWWWPAPRERRCDLSGMRGGLERPRTVLVVQAPWSPRLPRPVAESHGPESRWRLLHRDSQAGAMSDLFQAIVLTDKLRSDFKVLADLIGPDKAFCRFACEAVERGRDDETKAKFLAIFRAVYDDYVGAP